MAEHPPHGFSFVESHWDQRKAKFFSPTRSTEIRRFLALVAEANTKLERLLAQSTSGSLHLLGDFNNRRPRF
jgi:hypothetical protein